MFAPSEAAKAYPRAYYQTATVGPLADNTAPCVLCGKGNNCVDHWMRHCIVLPLTLTLLIGTKALQGLEQTALQSQHGLALATQLLFQLRKVIHQKKSRAQLSTHHTNNLRAACRSSCCLACHRNHHALPHNIPTTAGPRMYATHSKCAQHWQSQHYRSSRLEQRS